MKLVLTRHQFSRVLRALHLAKVYEEGLADAWSGKHGDWRNKPRREALCEAKRYEKLREKLLVFVK